MHFKTWKYVRPTVTSDSLTVALNNSARKNVVDKNSETLILNFMSEFILCFWETEGNLHSVNFLKDWMKAKPQSNPSLPRTENLRLLVESTNT